jgi:hypothetical protein
MAMTDWTNWHIDAVAAQHRDDLLREAQDRRLIRQAAPADSKPQHFYRRSLAWLGRRLIVWGSRLQQRYGAEKPVSRMQARSHTG